MSLELASFHPSVLHSADWPPDQGSLWEDNGCHSSSRSKFPLPPPARSNGSPSESPTGQIKVMVWVKLVWVIWLSTYP